MLCLSQKISVDLDNNVGHRSLVSFLGTRCYCSLLYEQSQCSNGCRLIVPPSDYCDALIFKNSFLEKVGPSTETQGLWVDLKSGRESLRTLSYRCILLVPENLCIFLPNQSEVCFRVLSSFLTRIWERKLICSPCLCGPFDNAFLGWKVPVSAHNVRERIVEIIRENPTGNFIIQLRKVEYK